MIGKIIGAGFIVAALWTGVVAFGFYYGWFLTPIASQDDLEDFSEAVEAKIQNEQYGNIALVVIRDGQIAHEFYDSAVEKITGDSLFQIASVSKWVAALGVLALVEQGKVDLDAPVSTYLTRWKFPSNPFNSNEVTVRRLLSHTAGISSFGYFGFSNPNDLQSLEGSLAKAADTTAPGDSLSNASGVTRLVREPGSGWDYTGAGYTILQLVVEEVSGQDFSSYMDENIFSKLSMTDSTFNWQQAIDNRLVTFYDEEGGVAPHYLYTATAAASLYTTPYDLARLVLAYFGPTAELFEQQIISPELLHLARAPHGTTFGLGVYGLGTFRYAPNSRGDVIFGHDGSNYPAINTAVRVNPTTRDAIIVLCTGNGSLATRVAGDWVLWNTGNTDLVSLLRVYSETVVRWLAIGWVLVLLVVAVSLALHFRRR